MKFSIALLALLPIGIIAQDILNEQDELTHDLERLSDAESDVEFERVLEKWDLGLSEEEDMEEDIEEDEEEEWDGWVEGEETEEAVEMNEAFDPELDSLNEEGARELNVGAYLF